MSEVKFILKEPNSSNRTLIYLVHNYNYNRFKYSTKEKIVPKNWNFTNQRARQSKQFPENFELNARLNQIEQMYNVVFRRLLNDTNQLNNKELKNELDLALGFRKEKKGRSDIVSFAEDFITSVENNRRNSTITVYRSTLKHLKNFSSANNYKLDFDSIGIEFHNKFTKYLRDKLGLSNNTIGKYIKTVKTFLNEATEQGVNKNIEFKRRSFKVYHEEAENIYLTLDELEQIEKTELPNPRQEEIKDMFLVGCYTGLRFSDLVTLGKDHINFETRLISIISEKTSTPVTIPLHPVVVEILKKYGDKLPKQITNQAMNRSLKEIMRLCSINEKVETAKNVKGNIEKSIVKKHELVTVHTARRSFATNLFLSGVPSLSIMKITGHKTEKSFMKYIKISDIENAHNLLNHPFFAK
jgi:integrase